MEFSKKILIFIAIINIIIMIVTIVMVWRVGDLSPLTTLIVTYGAEGSTALGFYYSKSKVENKIKLMKKYDVELTENSFNDNSFNDSSFNESETIL